MYKDQTQTFVGNKIFQAKMIPGLKISLSNKLINFLIIKLTKNV